jgi:hypothetical protein
MSFAIRVVDDEDEGIEGVRVVLSFTDVTRGQTGAELTDSGGYAEFDGYDDGEVTVFINGAEYCIADYRDGDEISITK